MRAAALILAAMIAPPAAGAIADSESGATPSTGRTYLERQASAPTPTTGRTYLVRDLPCGTETCMAETPEGVLWQAPTCGCWVPVGDGTLRYVEPEEVEGAE